MTSIHRAIEQHASTRGEAVALVDAHRALTYRELNYAANSVARRLIAEGFRRGGHADVRLRRGADLAIVLLAVLKAGGSYAWIDPERDDSGVPPGVAIRSATSESDERYAFVDARALLRADVAYSPNLPVLTRASDIACVLRDNGAPPVGVPHATIAALAVHAVPQQAPWMGEAGALDLWMALLAGTTAVVHEQPAAVAAA